MNKIFIVSIFIFLYLTYKLINIFKTENVPTSNKIIAYVIYGVCMIGLVAVNIIG